MAVNTSKAQIKPLINHIAVYVVNLETSTNFYKNIIGLDVIPEPFHDGRHTWFSIGCNSHLHLIGGAPLPFNHDKNSHLCFSVPRVENFVIGLIKAGVVFEDWPGKQNAITTRTDGVKQIYFKDPDGWWIEINDAK